MSEPPADPKSDDVPDPKPKDKGLDKFIGKVVDGQPADQKVVIRSNAVDPPVLEDNELKEEIAKLHKEQYKMKREQKLGELETVNPEVAEKFKSKKLSDIETALEVAKVSSPKFPVNREAPVAEAAPRQGFKDPRDGKWK